MSSLAAQRLICVRLSVQARSALMIMAVARRRLDPVRRLLAVTRAVGKRRQPVIARLYWKPIGGNVFRRPTHATRNCTATTAAVP